MFGKWLKTPCMLHFQISHIESHCKEGEVELFVEWQRGETEGRTRSIVGTGPYFRFEASFQVKVNLFIDKKDGRVRPKLVKFSVKRITRSGPKLYGRISIDVGAFHGQQGMTQVSRVMESARGEPPQMVASFMLVKQGEARIASAADMQDVSFVGKPDPRPSLSDWDVSVAPSAELPSSSPLHAHRPSAPVAALPSLPKRRGGVSGGDRPPAPEPAPIPVEEPPPPVPVREPEPPPAAVELAAADDGKKHKDGGKKHKDDGKHKKHKDKEEHEAPKGKGKEKEKEKDEAKGKGGKGEVRVSIGGVADEKDRGGGGAAGGGRGGSVDAVGPASPAPIASPAVSPFAGPPPAAIFPASPAPAAPAASPAPAVRGAALGGSAAPAAAAAAARPPPLPAINVLDTLMDMLALEPGRREANRLHVCAFPIFATLSLHRGFRDFEDLALDVRDIDQALSLAVVASAENIKPDFFIRVLTDRISTLATTRLEPLLNRFTTASFDAEHLHADFHDVLGAIKKEHAMGDWVFDTLVRVAEDRLTRKILAVTSRLTFDSAVAWNSLITALTYGKNPFEFSMLRALVAVMLLATNISRDPGLARDACSGLPPFFVCWLLTKYQSESVDVAGFQRFYCLDRDVADAREFLPWGSKAVDITPLLPMARDWRKVQPDSEVLQRWGWLRAAIA